ncbi:MAG: M48 family metalloprotease [Pseudomonadota bacterium]
MFGKLLPLLTLAVAAIAVWSVSAWRSGRSLRRESRPLQNDQLDALIERLAQAADLPSVQVRLLENPIPNGMVTASGDIYLTRGLFKHFQSGRLTGPEIASVVAHELGHLALGHTKRRMVDIAGAQAAQLVLGGILARFIPFFGWAVARLMSGWFIASLSRKDEFEADAFATALLMRAGFGADPQVRMLEKLGGLLPAGTLDEGRSWLASHPPVAERTAAIKENAQRWGAAKV